MALLAFANGANDNSKGVATLVGYGAATPRKALLWAMVTTLLGALFAFWFAGGLIKSFSVGLFAKGTPIDIAFFCAVLIGAIGWVLIATATGMPVSTTHAITGALAGAGMVAFGAQIIQWSFLGAKFAVPLAVSPLLSLAVVYLLAWPVVAISQKLAARCICVTETPVVAATVSQSAAALAVQPALVVDDASRCDERQNLAAIKGSAIADGFHRLTSGMVGFARGWNDAPKIAALGLVALQGSRGMLTAFAIVAVAMAIGGMIAGARVLDTLARKVTSLPLGESLTASTTTAVLVSMASWNGLPVSTTHVSTGAIIGAGLKHDPKAVRWGTVGQIALSWLVTLPVAALIACVAVLILRAFK